MRNEKMVFDEEKAFREINALSGPARYHLQHKLRNGLQAISASIEMGSHEDCLKAVYEMNEELKKLGI